MSKKTIAILTSGGDSPGMNAVVRAVVRTALNSDINVKGIMRGYEGLLSEDIRDLKTKDVSGIISTGGTILFSARCMEMMTEEGQEKAAAVCKKHGIDDLIVIGGDGSLLGAVKLSRLGINVIGIPGTIDLDLDCTDYTIGFDTAVNTAMEGIYKIRETTASHDRCSLVEVMGRNCGYIALWSALVGGADDVMIPESKDVTAEILCKVMVENRKIGKNNNLIVIAEGIGNTASLAKELEEKTGIETRATVLGYLQRGGQPTAVDRYHASIMGHLAVMSIKNGEKNRIIVVRDGKHISIDIEEGLAYKRPYNSELYDMIKTISV